MDKQKYRKVVINLITVIILSALVFLIFRKDYQAIWECICHVPALGVVLILLVDLGYQLIGSVSRLMLVRTRLPEFKMKQAVGITFLGVFGSVSTFSAGIIPMQSYYLYQCGVPAGSSVGMMILEYVFHKTTTFLYAAVMMFFYGTWVRETVPGLMKYIYIGFAVCALIISVLILICTWEKMQKFVLAVIRKLPDTGKWKQRKNKWQESLESLYSESRNILHNHGCCLKLILLDTLKLSCLYTIPFLCIRMIGFSRVAFGEAMALSAVMILLVGVLPSVAGIGPVEAAFMLLFSAYIGRVPGSAALVLYRIATYFFPFLISIGVFFVIEKKITATMGEKNGGTT